MLLCTYQSSVNMDRQMCPFEYTCGCIGIFVPKFEYKEIAKLEYLCDQTQTGAHCP